MKKSQVSFIGKYGSSNINREPGFNSQAPLMNVWFLWLDVDIPIAISWIEKGCDWIGTRLSKKDEKLLYLH